MQIEILNVRLSNAVDSSSLIVERESDPDLFLFGKVSFIISIPEV